MALYLMCVYGESNHSRWFREAWAKTGKKLDMGKSCVRFKKLDDLALDVIGEAIKRVPAKKYIEYCEAAITTNKQTSKGAGTASSSAESPQPKKSRAPTGKSPRGAK